MRNTRNSIFISVPIGRGIKYFLETPLYALLKSRYDLYVFLPFQPTSRFIDNYGGAGVEFVSHSLPDGSMFKQNVLRLFMWLRLFYSDFRLSRQSIGQMNLYTKKESINGAMVYADVFIIYPYSWGGGEW